MKWRQRTLFHWQKPRRVKDAEFRDEMARLRPVFLRLPLLVVIVLFGSWYLVQKYLPDVDFPLENLAGAAVLLFLLLGLQFVIVRYARTEYRLLEDAIRWNSGQHGQIVRWKDVVEASVQPHPLVDGIQIIRLKMRGRRMRSITLPEGDSAAEIVAAVRERVPKFVLPEDFIEPKRAEPLTVSDQAFLIGALVLYLFAIGNLFWRLPGRWINPYFFCAVLTLTLLLGPGTIGCFILSGFHWLRFRQLWPYAYVANMLALVLVMVIAVGVIYRRTTRSSIREKSQSHALSRMELIVGWGCFPGSRLAIAEQLQRLAFERHRKAGHREAGGDVDHKVVGIEFP